ncbi:MAG: RNA polymerase sigma factor [Candidatus Kapabacteria bacterium]|nr:RNA polymerase sigma factor [Candidatus Kapabacteria bacterium]
MGLLGTSYHQLTDEQLMELVGRGKSSALNELYARYSKRLLFYFRRMLNGDIHKAEDFLHDVFLRVIERPHVFDGARSFSTWIFSCAHNACKNEYRRLQVRNDYNAPDADYEFDELVQADADAIERIDRETFRTMLNATLDDVHPDSKTIFLLRYAEDFTLPEIAEVTGIPLGTVKSRLFYLIRHIAQQLKMFAPNTRNNSTRT